MTKVTDEKEPTDGIMVDTIGGDVELSTTIGSPVATLLPSITVEGENRIIPDANTATHLSDSNAGSEDLVLARHVGQLRNSSNGSIITIYLASFDLY